MHIETQTNHPRMEAVAQRRPARESDRRLPAWRPEKPSLTRDEFRAIVREVIG